MLERWSCCSRIFGLGICCWKYEITLRDSWPEKFWHFWRLTFLLFYFKKFLKRNGLENGERIWKMILSCRCSRMFKVAGIFRRYEKSMYRPWWKEKRRNLCRIYRRNIGFLKVLNGNGTWRMSRIWKRISDEWCCRK